MDKESMRNINVERLKEIMRLHFGVTETVLYLDTHPYDTAVLQLQNEFASRLQNAIEQYQRKYGPLVHSYDRADSPWEWINEPWPWQIDY